MADQAAMKKHITEIIEKEGADSLTAKTVREKLEKALNMEPGSLKPQKQLIGDLIDAAIEAQPPPAGADEAEQQQQQEEEDEEGEGEEEEEDEAPAPKKARKAQAANGGEPKPKKSFSCTTKSGKDPPKDLKKMQSKLIKAKDFLSKGDRITINICGNTLTADPREFSGGGKGWYTGGKIEVSINGKPCWAQASINISVPGSKEWK